MIYVGVSPFHYSIPVTSIKIRIMLPVVYFKNPSHVSKKIIRGAFFLKTKFMAFIIASLLVAEAVVLLALYELYKGSQNATQIFAASPPTRDMKDLARELTGGNPVEPEKLYSVHVGDKILDNFETYDEALKEADLFPAANIMLSGEIIWENYSKFYVTQNDDIIGRFEIFEEALTLANYYAYSAVSFTKTGKEIWNRDEPLQESVLIDVKTIKQMPELARGCEVTSLAMLLSHAGLDVSKMTLAEEIVKNPIPIQRIGGKVYAGDMNEGFLGNIYSFKNDGIGVYNKPIYNLAKNYLGDSVLNITEFEFDEVYRFLNKGYPVWIITTSTFSKLPESSFQTWYLPDETPMRVTYREHSVLITGYDKNYIYFNDPFSGHSKMRKKNFIEAWEQMGKQAVTYTSLTESSYSWIE